MDYRNQVQSQSGKMAPIGGIAGAGTEVPSRNTHIQAAGISLEAAVEDVQAKLVELEKRLYPILRPCPPDCQNQAKELEQFVPLAESLRVFSFRLNSCSVQLSSILERIEL